MKQIRGYGSAIGVPGKDVTKGLPAHIHTMILRTGKYGEFYGCIEFPKCRYTEKLEGTKPGCADMHVVNRDKSLFARSS